MSKNKSHKPKRTPEELAVLKITREEREARFAVIKSRCAGIKDPDIPTEALEFAHSFTRWHLLDYLYDALDAPAADTYLVDSGYDCSMHARRANETNRERIARGVSLSDNDDPYMEWNGDKVPNPYYYQELATIGDLFNAPTGNTKATFVSRMGLAAESWDDSWYEDSNCAGDNLDICWMIAGLVLNNDVTTLENIARTPLGDVHPSPMKFDGVADDVLHLAREALLSWSADADGICFNPEEEIDLTLSVAELPKLLMSAQRSWSRQELLALTLAGLELDPVYEV